ncbi:MAG: TRAP transporter large permease [Sagittula sp.]|jgi:tripartite ATP-independent transporter DctM subunit|uniref:TRAP transporter large permease n=2 Tax=Sagittula TaxID=58842 RepID=UPI000C2D5D95|nr:MULTISPECIES: TRAP transporter large permease [unclassified Sagittula]AUC53933.1 transporter [Sagittula sp. P11]WHZ34670.1 TRAP transporter large permease [Sagittula sp. MA-2]
MTALPILIFSVALLLGGAVLAHLIGAASILSFIAADRARFLAAAPQRIIAHIDLFSIMSMPLFILAGEIMNRAGVTKALIDLAMALMARLKGGLGHVNILTSVFFAGISGSAMADAAAVSNTLVPAMRKSGYTVQYAGAVTAASSVIGPIIPPSIIMIFYGALMNTSVAALFIAGIVPGLIMAVALFGANAWLAHRHDHPTGERVPAREVLRRAIYALPATVIPVIILSGIVFGVMTPTEAAGVAVCCAILAGIIYRQMSWGTIIKSLERTAILSGSIFILLSGVAIFGYLAGLEKLPTLLADALIGLGFEGWKYLLLLNAVFLVAGMFLEVPVALALLVPLLVPTGISMGADPIHLGIVIVVNLMLGIVTPPFGAALLVVSAVSGAPYWGIAKAAAPFLVVQLGVLLILTFTPELTLFLPRLAGFVE